LTIRLHARKGAGTRKRQFEQKQGIMNPVKALENHGQSIWLDFLARGFVAKGDLRKLIDTDGVKGVTSNPSIFEKAIGSSDEYDGAIGQALKKGDRPVAELFEQLAVEDIRHAADKVAATGNSQVLLTERGSSFGYNNLVVDMRGLKIMRDAGWPVIFDATHSVQLPGGAGAASGGQPQFIEPLARAAVAAGVDGVFVEVHEAPERALSDGANALRLSLLGEFWRRLQEIHRLVNSWES